MRHRKPHPEVYLRATQIVGASARQIIVHEDSPPGVVAAKGAGDLVAAFPAHDGIAFEPMPAALFDSWTDLTPEMLVDRVLAGTSRITLSE